MKKIDVLTMTMIAIAWLASTAHASNFEDGLVAYNAGEYAKALEIFEPLAESGGASSQHLLGHMYLLGEGVEMDEKQAVQWFREAAKHGFSIKEPYGEHANNE